MDVKPQYPLNGTLLARGELYYFFGQEYNASWSDDHILPGLNVSISTVYQETNVHAIADSLVSVLSAAITEFGRNIIHLSLVFSLLIAT